MGLLGFDLTEEVATCALDVHSDEHLRFEVGHEF